MGYTHYFDCKKGIEVQDWNIGFAKAAPILSDILQRYKSIIRYESDVQLPAALGPDYVRFNGIREEGHETFIVQHGEWSFCKTARKEYDLPVCECLLVLKTFIPKLKVSSDGFCAVSKDALDGCWDQAIKNVKERYGIETEVIIEKRPDSEYEKNSPYMDVKEIICKVA